jgi:hypothetical protein
MRLFKPRIRPPPPDSRMFWRSRSWYSGLNVLTSLWIDLNDRLDQDAARLAA